MITKVRRLAVGTAILLCAASAPLLTAPSAVAAPASTTLTGVQARDAFVTARATAIDQALRRGARVVSTDEDVDKSDSWIKYRWTATIDAQRHTLRRSETVTGDYAVAAVGYENACGGYDPADVWDVAKAKVGRWDDIDGPKSLGAPLRLLDKPKARWTKVVDKRTTMRTLVTRSVEATSYGGADRFDRARFDAGVRTATEQGYTYALTFRLTNGKAGRLTMDTDSRGALVRLRAELPRGHFTASSVVNTTVSYGTQRVVAPTAKRWVAAKDLLHACEAVELTRTGVLPLAKSIAESANWPKGPTTVKDIHESAKGFSASSLVRITSTRTGVTVTGRSTLLPRSFVATVFVRSGKAVARSVS